MEKEIWILSGSVWLYSPDHGQLCQIINTDTLWDEAICSAWLPSKGIVIRIPKNRLISLDNAKIGSSEYIAYVTAAARIANELTQDILLAPIESSVIPLPHQIRALSRAIASDRVRYLLADEVGLGKTIEAGLIMRELKIRGLVRRTLVISPKGLVNQWVAEMFTHFNEQFQPVLSDDIIALNRLLKGSDSHRDFSSMWEKHNWAHNPWLNFSQIVVSMDSVKPLEKRYGWSAEQVNDYNRDRFENLISANWDLVIIDEAHRLGGSTDQVARFKLGQGLSEAAPYLLMLSATPHQGKTDAFYRLFSLIEPEEFPVVSSITSDRVKPYVIRTEKRNAIDAEGKPLFKPRITQLVPVTWGEKHRYQQLLYEAVTEYVRKGYNQAIEEKRNYIGFLMVLMQRLVVSSTSAIRTTLEKRLEVISAPEEQLTIFPNIIESWFDLDGQEQTNLLLISCLSVLKDEYAEVKMLLDATELCEQAGPDVKAETLLDWIYHLQSEENNPELKFLIFTEFLPTQAMLQTYLKERGFSVVCLNGSMNMEERKQVQAAFAENARILISTDAGGEGINLQFCNIVINYDIPWNPMRLEQRIGRVDRIGQAKIVRAINFIFQNSIENRVREVLDQKLSIIYSEFGIDKTSDILDSAEGGKLYDELYINAIRNPEAVETKVEEIVAKLQEQIQEARLTSSILGKTEGIQPGEAQKLMRHPLPQWVERMTINYLKANGGQVEKKQKTWELKWSDGQLMKNVVFSRKEADNNPTAWHLTLEESKVRKIVMNLPRFVPGQPIPIIFIPEISNEVRGFWSIWQISVNSKDWNRRKILPLFTNDHGKVFIPTSKHIWDQLLTKDIALKSFLEDKDRNGVYNSIQEVAKEYGESIYEELVKDHKKYIERKKLKGNYAFAARRRNIERIGLPQVRSHRLSLLVKEEKILEEQIDKETEVFPEMFPLLIIRVEGCV